MRGVRLYCGHTSGQIKIYDLVNCSLCVSVCAHARAINALEVHPTRDIFATVAEDCMLAVWSLAEPTPTLTHVEHTKVQDWLLTGVSFCGGHERSHVACSAYDTAAVQSWRLD